jgi:hypothetical protein
MGKSRRAVGAVKRLGLSTARSLAVRRRQPTKPSRWPGNSVAEALQLTSVLPRRDERAPVRLSAPTWTAAERSSTALRDLWPQ